MANSPVKSAVLALTAAAATDEALQGWRYYPSRERFVLSPCEGVTVTLEPLWTFKVWYAITQPSVDIESNRLSKIYKSVLGRRPKFTPVSYLYQQIWHRTGRSGCRPSFWEDFPGERGKDERLVDEVPEYIAELVADYEKYIAPQFDFSSEDAFLKSLPGSYRYFGYPLQDALHFILTRLILRDSRPFDTIVSDMALPPSIFESLSEDIERIRLAAPTLLT